MTVKELVGWVRCAKWIMEDGTTKCSRQALKKASEDFDPSLGKPSVGESELADILCNTLSIDDVYRLSDDCYSPNENDLRPDDDTD